MENEKALFTVDQVAVHNSPNDCWLIVEGQVWDFSSFVHPGGSEIIHRYAGKDATRAFNEVHNIDVLNTVSNNITKLGTCLVLSYSKFEDSSATLQDSFSLSPKLQPPSILSTYDFEVVAQKILSPKAWAFYSSAATDLISVKANQAFYDRVWFRPRLLRDVTTVNSSSKISGVNSNLPFFIAPCAMAKLGHKEGELGIARACHKKGIIQCICINASYTLESITSSVPSSQPFFFQLYVNKDRSISKTLMYRAWKSGIRTLFLTIDAPVPGKREADERVMADESLSTPMVSTKAGNDERGGGITRKMGTYITPALLWKDLAWVREHWMGRLVIKGVQSAEDAICAMEYGVEAIIVSNHGGRNLDTSPPPILTLLELHKRCPEIFDKMEVYIDGGIRRGSDVLKALCLGARAVGVGRPALYALAANGQKGVESLIDILKDELETSMRLVGITDLTQVHAGLVNTAAIDYMVPSTRDHPYVSWRPAKATL